MNSYMEVQKITEICITLKFHLLNILHYIINKIFNKFIDGLSYKIKYSTSDIGNTTSTKEVI